MRREKVKINRDPQTGEIVNLSHDGKGVARVDGKATFIQGALPGEIVEFQYLRVKKDFDEGKLLSITKPSTLRVEPRCPHFQLCGGCSLQHLDEKEQIRFKEHHLMDLLNRYGHTQPLTVLPALTCSPWNYRNKARLSTRYVEKKQVAMVGFRERNNPRYITDINQCPILNSKVDKDIPYLRALINAMEDKHCIAQIELAAGDDDVALLFRNLSSLSKNDELLLCQFGASRNYRIFLQPSGPDSVYCIYPLQQGDYLTYQLPEYGISFQFHPNDFTQVNSELNRKMVGQAIELMELKHSDNVLDLFCGLGNFSLPMAKNCSMVVGVEGSKTMVERAYMNATANQIDNVEFYAANLDDPNEVRGVMKKSYDKVLLDPPRSGALEIVHQMDSINPERIVYVSCNPITLARDTDVLVNQKGYRLISAGVMDMFPHTAHVESIALFQKG